MPAVDYLLLEAPVGYGLFQVVEQPDTIGGRLKEVQEAANDLGKFKQMVKLVSFAPFQFVLSPAGIEFQLLTNLQRRRSSTRERK